MSSEDVTQIQQERLEAIEVTLTWHASKYKVYKLTQSTAPQNAPPPPPPPECPLTTTLEQKGEMMARMTRTKTRMVVVY